MAKNVLTKFFIASLLSGTFLAPAAATAEEGLTYFYPKNKWTVEKVSMDGKLPICSISNQLNNGYIVQLAGTSKGLTNLNIDFRQDAFQTNQKYEVQYTVPGQSATLVPTKAFKESLLVSDLRKKSEFSDSLLNSATMDVSVRGNKFRVYLTGLEANLKEFNDCTDPGGEMASAAKNAAQQKRLLSSEPKVSENLAPLPPVNLPEVASAAQRPVLTGTMKRPDFENKERYSDKIAQKLKKESEKYKPAANPTPAKVKESQKEEIEPQSAAITAPADSVETASTQEKKYAAAIHDVKKTIKKDGAVYNITTSEKPVMADLTSLDKRNTESASDAISEEPEVATVDAFEPAAGIPRDGGDSSTMRSKIEELEKQLSVLMSKNSMLDEELKLALSDSKQEKLTVSSDNWNLEKATMKFNESERQVLRLGRQLQSTKAQCDQEKQKLETMLFDPELTNQQQLSKLSSLEAELDESKSELYRQQRQYEERIKLLEARLNTQ